MRLVTYNIQYTKGRDGRYDAGRIADEVTGADIIALQEVERYFERSGNTDQVASIAEALPDHHWIFGAGVSLSGGTGRGANRSQFGNMLLSRWPILSHRSHLLPKYASTGPVSIQRTAEEGVVDTPAGRIRFYSVHLTHLAAATRLPQVDRLLEIHRNAPLEGMPLTGAPAGDWYPEHDMQQMPGQAVFMGDFNFEPDSLEYQRIVGPLSEYGGRVTNPEGFVDAWVSAGNPPDAGFSADIDGRPVRLDYLFTSTVLAAGIRRVWVDDSAAGSDHKPVWMEMANR